MRLSISYCYPTPRTKGENMQGISKQVLLDRVAPGDGTILLLGATGTGKSHLAQEIHARSSRSHKPFMVVNLATLNENLIESELFGHERGAFSSAHQKRIGKLEAAQGGTVFLDEISEIDPSVQVKLLRVLETRSFERVGGTERVDVDVRLVAATNRNLKQMVEDGDFREDLYYRLDVLNLVLPPLRERPGDIPLLMAHFLAVYKSENGKEIEGITPEAMKVFEAYTWPGNVRQLKNCVERMVVLCRTKSLGIKDIPSDIRDEVERGPITKVMETSSLDIDANEKVLIEKALLEAKGRKTKAAEILGISRRTLYRKLDEYGIDH